MMFSIFLKNILKNNFTKEKLSLKIILKIMNQTSMSHNMLVCKCFIYLKKNNLAFFNLYDENRIFIFNL